MKKSNNVKSVLKALNLFNVLVTNGEPMSLSSLSNKTNINISTAYRLLNTMVSIGYIKHDDQDHYYIGNFAYKIADLIQDSFNLKEFIFPYLEDIVNICNETANFSIMQNFQVLYVDQVESTHMLKIIVKPKDTIPAYCTASGKVLLAYLNKLRLQKYLEKTELIHYSKNTITEPAILIQVLKKIKEQEYALEIEEYEEDVISVAAPILDKNKKLQGAISVSGPCSRINSLLLKDKLIPLVNTTAKEISSNLLKGN